MARLIRTDGVEEQLDDVSLESLQAAVGGYIQIVYINTDEMLVINEEGKLLNLSYNKEATLIVQGLLFIGDYIAGPAVYVNRNENPEAFK